MNVDRRWLGTSVVRVRVLVAGLALLAAGGMVLGFGSRSRTTTASHPAVQNTAVQNNAVQSTAIQNQAAFPLSPVAQVASLAGEAGPQPAATPQSRARSIFAGLPLMFEPNQGQAGLNPTDQRVQFIARGEGYALLLGSDGAILSLRSKVRSTHAASAPRIESLHMKLAGSNPSASLKATDLLSSKTNYFLGNDPAKWQHDVPEFARVGYENIYPGINLVFYGSQGQLEYDFQVAPGSDPAQAELEFDGAKRLALENGALIIKAKGGDVRLDAPRVYQQINGHQQAIDGGFVLRAANRVGFAIGTYDHSRELVIDPVLRYSTYFGGTGDELNNSVAVDNLGNIYLSGSTTSANLPTIAGNYQLTLAGTQNVYIAKINPTLGTSGLIYVTYLGGNGADTPVGIAVDSAGNPYVAGTTTSTNFPTTLTAYQTAPVTTTSPHVFVTELNNITTSNPGGIATALLYSSYLSGNGTDVASGMTIDANGFLYVTGTTTSIETSGGDQFPASNLPQALPYQNISKFAGQPQFFVTKVFTLASRSGSIAYSTYFGGGTFNTAAAVAVGGGIAVDNNGNIYFTGTTNYEYTGVSPTTDFPILNAYQPCLDVPAPIVFTNPQTCTISNSTVNTDAFVAKLNPNAVQGQQLQWSTYVGGTDNDEGKGIAIDTGAANVYVIGTTRSTDVTALTTFAAYQRCLDTPVNPAAGTACPAPAGTAPYPTDAFVARLTNPALTATTGMALTYFSYLGGTGNEVGNAITVDSASGALMTGYTQSTDFPVFPTPNAIQTNLNGTQDAFVARLNTIAATGQNTTASWANYFGGSGIDEGTGIALDTNQITYLVGDTNSVDLQVSGPLQAANQGGYDAFATKLSTAAILAVQGVLSLGTNQTYVTAGNQAQFNYTIQNNGPDLATGITFTDALPTSGVTMTPNSISASSGGSCSTPTGTSSTLNCSFQSLQSGSTATVTVVLTPTPNAGGGSSSFNGGAVTVTATNGINAPTTSVSGRMSDFSITASPNNVTVPQAGDTATYQVQLTPSPIYGSSVTLTVTGLPTGAASSFSTSPVTMPTTSPASTVLSVSTTARPITTPAASLFSRHFYAVWLFLPGLVLFGLGSNRRRRRIAGVLLTGVVAVLIGLQPACSSNSTQPPPSGTPAGTYPLTIAASSGSDTKNYTVYLTVP